MTAPQVRDIISQIDEYIGSLELEARADAEFHDQRSRPQSRGTMLLDWDGYNLPVVSYRRRSCDHDIHNDEEVDDDEDYELESESSSTQGHSSPFSYRPHDYDHHHYYHHQHVVTDETNHQLHYYSRRQNHPSQHPSIYVQGFDPETQTAYDYDGRIMHVQHAESRNSEYYAVDARSYMANTQTWTNIYEANAEAARRAREAGETTTTMASRRRDQRHQHQDQQERKKSKVVKLVAKVFRALDTLGVIQRFRDSGSWDGSMGPTKKRRSWKRWSVCD